jgi:hypothetical protein
VAPPMNIIDAEISPHTIMVPTSQRRAPKRSSARLLGTPKIT